MEQKQGQKPKRFSMITYDQAVKFFQAVTPNAKCFACGHDSWTVMTSKDDDLTSEAGLPLNGTGPHYYPVILTICGKCGFVKPHHSHVLLKWLEENEESAEPDTDHKDAEGD